MCGTQALGEVVPRNEADARATVARDERRDGDLQPVEQIRLQEVRDGGPAALDEHGVDAARVQDGEQPVQREASGRGRDADDLGEAVPRRTGVAAVLGRDQQRRCRGIAEDAKVRAQAPARVEHDAHGIRARHPPDRQARIVERDGLGPDDDGAAQGAHPVQMQHVLGARDVIGIPGIGRDVPVERLAEVGDREGPFGRGVADRQIEVEQGCGLGVRGTRRGAPAQRAVDEQTVRPLSAGFAQPAGAIDAGAGGRLTGRTRGEQCGPGARDGFGLGGGRFGAWAFGTNGQQFRSVQPFGPRSWYPSTVMKGSPDTAGMLGINGSEAGLAFDRAVGELRRGRALRLVEPGPQGAELVIAAVETVHAPLLRRLEAAGRELLLLLTPERAEAAELARDAAGPVAGTVPAGTPPEALRALASMSPVPPAQRTILRVDTSPSHPGLVEAGFQLAKAGRLLPALVGIEAAGIEDPSLLRVEAPDVRRRTHFAPHSLKRMSQSRVPLADALDCELVLFRDEHGLGEHVAVIIGQPRSGNVVPVRLHSACLTGDLLGSLRCDCGEQLRTAVARIAELGGGVLLYLDQEGRGIGLANKLRAYALQDSGFDTIDADRHLGFLADERNYEVAVAMLQDLGYTQIRLLTNNPHKIDALKAHGIKVTGRVSLIGQTNRYNERYLRTKRERAGHLAEEPEV